MFVDCGETEHNFDVFPINYPGPRGFLDFSPLEMKKKTSGYLGLKSHFHAGQP